MKVFLAVLVATSALTSVADAADKPVIAPAPAWVKSVNPPLAPAKADEAPVRILLSDQQVALEPGRQTVYSETSLKIQTPQGLAAGNISLPWRPETDVLTVHKLLIRRGDQTIDVLKSGQTFTVLRREQNLGSATLDGVLTANIQPEGLQVGDTLEFAASVSSSDPTLKAHVEQIAGAWNGFPIGRAHLRIQWPSSLPARLRQTASLPALKPTKTGNTSTVELSLDDVEPIIPPKGAPPRYRIGRFVEVTDYASWADLGALMAPLYEEAAAIPAQGPLRSELERILSLSPDPKVRTETALALVQDRVRYVALAMGAGGYVPADAETTWSRRYGDCKGKTALLLALLHAMDIAAEPVAVSTTFGDGLDERLPMVGLFNHVLVRASVAGRTYWLDGTRTGDTSLDRLTTPNFGWGLPLVAKSAALVRMIPSPLAVPTQDTSIRIDASAGISAPAPTKVETILRGDEAIGTNVALANLVGEARDRALRDYWKNQYDFIDVKTASATFAAVTTVNPNNSYAHVVAANIYSAFHKDTEAMRAFDKAIALKPEAYIYLNRSLRRPKVDVAGRRADLDAALKLEPNLTEAIAQKADLQADSGDLTGAISTYSSALVKSPDDLALLMGRGVAYARLGDAAHADADFQRAREKAAEPVIFNNMCWTKALPEWHSNRRLLIVTRRSQRHRTWPDISTVAAWFCSGWVSLMMP